MVLLAAISSLFLTTFGGVWTCTTHEPATQTAPASVSRVAYSIGAAPGGNWTTVRWGLAGGGGIAYVAYVPATKQWLYDDYHYDGSFFRDFSTGPDSKGVWRWYDSHDQLHMDMQDGPEEWQRLSATLFRQTRVLRLL